jgi:hypothetical protein
MDAESMDKVAALMRQRSMLVSQSEMVVHRLERVSKQIEQVLQSAPPRPEIPIPIDRSESSVDQTNTQRSAG